MDMVLNTLKKGELIEKPDWLEREELQIKEGENNDRRSKPYRRGGLHHNF